MSAYKKSSEEQPQKAEDSAAPYFKMDRSVVRQFASFEEADSLKKIG